MKRPVGQPKAPKVGRDSKRTGWFAQFCNDGRGKKKACNVAKKKDKGRARLGNNLAEMENKAAGAQKEKKHSQVLNLAKIKIKVQAKVPGKAAQADW